MEKKIIHTANAPQAIGPYSQAVQMGNMLFLSGQIAINPQLGELEITDVTSETNRVMKNIIAVFYFYIKIHCFWFLVIVRKYFY